MIGGHALMPLVWAIIAVVPAGADRHAHWLVLVLVAAGQFLHGLAIGYRPTLWIATAGFAVVAVTLAASPFRHARHGD